MTMEESLNFLPLLLVMLLVFGVPMILGRIRWLPVVVGEIFAGILIGHSGLNLIGESAILEVMSNIGLAFLMFLAGMEINIENLLNQRRGDKTQSSPGLISLVALVTLLLAVPGGFLLNRLGLEGDPWLLAFVLSATSLGVLLPILKQRQLTHTRAGYAIFYSAVLADFVTVILLTIFIILTVRRSLDLEVFSVALLFLAFFVVYRLAVRFFRLNGISKLVEELSSVTVQIKVRGAIAILVAFVVLAGLLGIELILGAFLAGMIIALLKRPEDDDLVEKLEAFGFGFFIPVFFIMVGVNLDLRALFVSPQSLVLLPVLLLVATGVKTLPALLFKRILTWRETLAGGVLLNTHLSLEIVVAVIGVRLGLLSESANVVIILFAALSVLIMPVLFNALLPEVKKEEDGFYLIFGAEDQGLQVAKALRQHEVRVRLLEVDPRLVAKARQDGFETIQSDTLVDCVRYAVQGNIKALLVLSSDDTRNLLVSHAARQLDVDYIVALVNDPAKLPEYRSLGVNTFTPTLYQPAFLSMMARNKDLFRIMTSTVDEQDVREVHLRNRLLQGEPLRSLALPGDLTILSIGRNGNIIVPHGNTRLELGDRLTIFGDFGDLQHAEQWLSSSLS